MKSHEVLHQAIQRDAVEHAKALGMNTRTVYKWMEPTVDFSDSGALNPLDRIETVIATAQRLGQPSENAFAPIQYLATRFGGVYIPSIPCNSSISELNKSVFAALAGFSDLMQSVGLATAPTSESGVNISQNERKAIHLSGMNAVQLITALLAVVEREAA